MVLLFWFFFFNYCYY